MAQRKEKTPAVKKTKLDQKNNSSKKTALKKNKVITTTAKKEQVPAVVNLGGNVKEVSKKGLVDLKYSDYYKNYLANKKENKLDNKKIVKLFKKSAKPKTLGFTKIEQPKVFTATAPISYTKEVANNGYSKYFNKPSNQTIQTMPTVAVNLPAPISPTQPVVVEPNYQQQYPNFVPPQVLPQINHFGQRTNNFYRPDDSNFANYNQQNFNRMNFPVNNNNQNYRPNFNQNYSPYNGGNFPKFDNQSHNQTFSNYPNTLTRPVSPYNSNVIDNISTEQLFNFNPMDYDQKSTKFNNPNALVVPGPKPDSMILNQVTRLLDVVQRQMLTQQIFLEKQQSQIEHQQEIIERLQTKLIEGQQVNKTNDDFYHSDTADIEATDFLETQEENFKNYPLETLDKTKELEKQNRYKHFVNLSATKKVADKKRADDTVHVTDTLEYETDEIGSDEIEATDLVEYTDFDDGEDLIDPNLGKEDFESKEETVTNKESQDDDEFIIKTTAEGQIVEPTVDQDIPNEKFATTDDEYTDLVSEEIDDSSTDKYTDEIEEDVFIKTNELEEVDEDADDEYTDLVTEEYQTEDLNKKSSHVKSDLIATSIIENLEEDETLDKSKKKDLNLSETKLSPTKRFWEPLVGDPKYGFYNNKSWNWIGYFDRLKKWIPYTDSDNVPINPTFHNSLITKKVNKVNFWKKLIDNLDYGHRENGNWVWDGVFDQNFNWIPDPTAPKITTIEPASDSDVDNVLYQKYIGDEYYGYYDDDHKWVWTGKFTTDGTFIPNHVDFVIPTTPPTPVSDVKQLVTEDKKVKKDAKAELESITANELKQERKRLKQERKRLKKLQSKINQEAAVAKKTTVDSAADFDKIPNETIEEIISQREPSIIDDELIVINTQDTKDSAQFWDAFLGDANYGHYNDDQEWIWDGYFDDEHNWIPDAAIVQPAKISPNEIQPAYDKTELTSVIASMQPKSEPEVVETVAKISSNEIQPTYDKTELTSVIASMQLKSEPEVVETVAKISPNEIQPTYDKTELTSVIASMQPKSEPEVVELEKPTTTADLVSDDTNIEVSYEETKNIDIPVKLSDEEKEQLKTQLDKISVVPDRKVEEIFIPAPQKTENIVIDGKIEPLSTKVILPEVNVQEATTKNILIPEAKEEVSITPTEHLVANEDVQVALEDLEPVIVDKQPEVELAVTSENIDLTKNIVDVAHIHEPEAVVETAPKLYEHELETQPIEVSIDSELPIEETKAEQADNVVEPAIISETPIEIAPVVETTSEEPNEFSVSSSETPIVDVEFTPEISSSEEQDIKPSSSETPIDEVTPVVETTSEEPSEFRDSLPETPIETPVEEPVVEYWEQFVGNNDYGQYDADGNWEWSGYFDDNNNWVPNESIETPPASGFEAGLSPEVEPEQQVAEPASFETPVEEPVAEYWEQFVGNEDYGQYDADGNWEWSGYFDDNNNWIPNESVETPPASGFEAGLSPEVTPAVSEPETPVETLPEEQPVTSEILETPAPSFEAELTPEITPATSEPKEEEEQQVAETTPEVPVETTPEQPTTVEVAPAEEPNVATEKLDEVIPSAEPPAVEEPVAEYWEQFVGNEDYGQYDADGNWEWSGYFDDDNNWIPNEESAKDEAEDENTEIVEAVEGTNFISADSEGKIDFDKYVGDENFGYYDDNNEWEWYEGDFDEDGNWMVYEQGEPDKKYDITKDIPVFKDIDTDSVDADEWLSQFNEDDADSIFGGK